MKTHLFEDVKEDWNLLANKYSSEIHQAIRPILEKAKADGISLRDLQLVINATVEDLILSQIFS